MSSESILKSFPIFVAVVNLTSHMDGSCGRLTLTVHTLLRDCVSLYSRLLIDISLTLLLALLNLFGPLHLYYCYVIEDDIASWHAAVSKNENMFLFGKAQHRDVKEKRGKLRTLNDSKMLKGSGI